MNKWWLLLIGLPLTLIMMLSGLVLTHRGNGLLLSLASRLEPRLSVNLESGTLLGNPRLRDIVWKSDGLEVSLTELEYQINWDCLPEKICTNFLKADGVEIVMPAISETNETDQGVPMEDFRLPVSLALNNIELTRVGYRQPGVSLEMQHLSTDFLFDNEQGAVLNPELSRLLVEIQADNRSESQAEAENLFIGDDGTLNLPQFSSPLPVQIRRGQLENLTLNLPQGSHSMNQIRLDLNLVDSLLSIHRLAVETRQYRVKVMGNVSLQQQYPLKLELKLLVKQFEPFTGQQISLNLDGDMATLYPQIELSGPITAQLEGFLSPLSRAMDHQLKFEWQQFQWPLDAAAVYRSTAGEINLDGTLKNSKLRLSGDFSASDLPDSEVQLKGKISVEPDLAALSLDQLLVQTLGGSAEFNGELSMGEKIHWQGGLVLDAINPGKFWQQYTGLLSGTANSDFTLSGDDWELAVDALDVTGRLNENNFQLGGNVRGNNRAEWWFNQFNISSGDNHLLIDGLIGEQNNLDGSLALNSPSSLVPGAAGTVHGGLKVRGTPDQPDITLDVNGAGLSYEEYQLKQINIKADIRNIFAAAGDITVDASGVDLGVARFEKLNLQFAGAEAGHSLVAQFAGQPASLEFELQGILQTDNAEGAKWTGTIDRARISSREGNWDLTDALGLIYTKGDLSVAEHCWAAKPATLCIMPATLGASGSLTAELNHYELARLTPLLSDQLKIVGRLQGSAEAAWYPDGRKPTVQLTVNTDNAELFLQQPENNYQLPIKKLTLKAELIEDRAAADIVVDILQYGILSMNAAVESREEQKIIDAELHLEDLNISVIRDVIPALDELEGEVVADIKFTGNLLRPDIDGHLNVTNGKAIGSSIPIKLVSFQNELVFDQYQARLNGEFTTGDGQGNIDGTLDWKDGFSADIDIEGERLEFDYQSQAVLFLSPQLNLVKTDDTVILSGDIHIPQGQIEIAGLPASSVSLSSDIVIVDQPQQQPEKNIPVGLDINLHLGKNVAVNAFGLQSNLGGDLSIKKSIISSPTVGGEISLVDGTYRAYGQDLEIQRGKIIFTGAFDHPYLSIRAIRNPKKTKDNVIAGVVVEGPVSEPKVEVFSQPDMDQNNALSYLLQGSALGSGGANDSAMLGDLLIAKGVGKSGNVLGKIGNSLGVEDLKLDSSGSGASTALEVGGNIHPDVQIKYRKGLFNSLTDVVVRYDFLPNFYVEAVSGVSNALDLYYEFETD